MVEVVNQFSLVSFETTERVRVLSSKLHKPISEVAIHRDGFPGVIESVGGWRVVDCANLFGVPHDAIEGILQTFHGRYEFGVGRVISIVPSCWEKHCFQISIVDEALRVYTPSMVMRKVFSLGVCCCIRACIPKLLTVLGCQVEVQVDCLLR